MEEEYKRLLEEIRDAYFLVQNEKIVMVSNYMADYWGYSKDELIGMPFLEMVAPEERDRLTDISSRRKTGQPVPVRYETLFLSKNGSRVLVEVTGWITSFQGKPAVAGTVVDISERRRMLEKLQDSEERYRSIVENSPDIIYTADPEGIIHSVNGAVRNILGYEPEDLIGRNFMDLIPEQAMARVTKDHNQLVDGNRVTSETLYISNEGEERLLEFRSVPLAKDGKVVMAQGIIRDITEEKRAEEKLNRIYESMTDGVAVVSLDGTVMDLNERMVYLTGYDSKDSVLGKCCFDFVAQSDRDRAKENMQKTLELEFLRDIEYTIIRNDGSGFCGELSSSVLRDAFGKAEGFISIIRDITKRKQAEITLRDSEEVFSKVFYNNPTAMTISRFPDGYILYANDSFARLVGCPLDEIVGHTSVELNVFGDPDERKRVIQALIDDKEAEGIEHIMYTRSRAFRTVLSWGKEVTINEQPHFISMGLDITERKQTEEKHRQLLEDMNDGYGVLRKGKYVFTNRSFCEIFGYKPGEMIGKPIGHLLADSDAQKEATEQYERVMRGEGPVPDRQEILANKKDGTPIAIELSSKLIQYEGEQAASVIVRDMTELKHTEEKYRRLVEDMNDGYGVIQDGKYVFVNRRFCEIFGYEAKQVIGKPFDEFILPEKRELWQDEYDKVLKGDQLPGERFEGEALKRDGVIITLDCSVKAMLYEDNPAFGVIVRDITERKIAEEALRESSEMLRLMFECAPYCVIVLDLKNTIIDANDQTLKLLGVSTKEEIIGTDGLKFINHSFHKTISQYHERCLEKGLILGIEHPLNRADGTTIEVETSAGILRNIDGNPIGLFAISRDITYEKQLRENKQFYIMEIIKAEENERRNLARALHDDTVQELLLATHRLHDTIAGNQGRLPKRAQRHLEDVKELIERTMLEVRGFTSDLRPGVLDDMGLIPALRWLLKRLSEGEGIDARLNTIGKERRLHSETELTLFRIAQESVSNIRKHASASSARITLEFSSNKVNMVVNDNGRGFELPEVISQFTREHKLGLTGIAERVRLLGGNYKLESSPNKGTTVRVEIGI